MRRNLINAVWVFVIVFIFSVSTGTVLACSVSFLEDKNSSLVARNMDWPTPSGLVVKNNRGVEKTALFTPENVTPYTWKSVYGSITFDLHTEFPGIGSLSEPGGGINEKGLYIGALFCDPPIYPGIHEKPALSCVEVVRFALDTCETVTDVIEMFDKFSLTSLQIGDEEFTAHWFVVDKNNECVIIEFPPESNGNMLIHKSPLYKCTTNEYYEWSYYYLYQYEAFNNGEYGGDKPLPDDTHKRTSDIRFVRNCWFSQEVMKKDSISIDDGFYVMGKVAQTEGTKGSTSPTDWTTVYDLKNLTITWTAVNNPERRFIDMKKLNFDYSEDFISLDIQSSGSGDVTNLFN